MRESVMQFRTTPELAEKVKAYAARLHLPASVLCAFAVAQYVDREERVMGPTVKAIGDAVTKAIVSELKGYEDAVEHVIDQAMTTMHSHGITKAVKGH